MTGSFFSRMLTMKKLSQFRKALLATAVCVCVASMSWPAAATGVPTVDAASLIQLKLDALEQAKQAVDALKMAKDGIDQVREQYNEYKGLISGNDKLGNFLNNPALNRVLPLGEWSDVYSTVQDISTLRSRYGLTSSNASVQQRFDQILSAADALERNYDASNDRVRNAEQLRAQLNVVQTPQQKADLQLRYQQELLEQQNQQARMANLQMLVEQQDKIEDTRRTNNFNDYMMGKSTTLPKYE
jgi:type IV secretion system protein VirB5